MGNCSSNDTVQKSENAPTDNQQASTAQVNLEGISLPHKHCRNGLYAGCEGRERFPVPDDKVDWAVDFPEYAPKDEFVPQPVPIPEDPDFRTEENANVQWNAMDDSVNRLSYGNEYEIIDKVPRNPFGRTGVTGRGKLARWGPNHAGDPIVTRWKRDENGEREVNPESNKGMLQFISIKRGDTGQWAIPGGFVDGGEEALNTLKREFGEEALDSTKATEEEKKEIQEKMDELFKNGTLIYKGYVDDPRNTDNSWMETTVMNFHDDQGDNVAKLKLQAGDDAVGVQWIDINKCLELYASHVDFVRMVAKKLDAHL